MKKGDKVTIIIFEAEIVDVSNAHGECFQIRLPQNDFQQPRDIWIDEGESAVKILDEIEK